MLNSAVDLLIFLNVLSGIVAKTFDVSIKICLTKEDTCTVWAFYVSVIVCGIAHSLS
jgi:hypothetical protein